MESGVDCVAGFVISEEKHPEWSALGRSLEGMLNAAKTNRELHSYFGLDYNERQFAEKFLEVLYPKGPKDPNGPFSIANYGEVEYLDYGIMGKIPYYRVWEKMEKIYNYEVWKKTEGKTCENLKKIIENLLKKPEERTPFGDEIKTLEKMAIFFHECAF